MRETRTERGREFLEAVESHADIASHRPELAERLDVNEQFRDAFVRAGDRAVEESDATYRDALARLVAAALDDARVDEVTLVITQLVKLEAVHLRVFVAMFGFSPSTPETATRANRRIGVHPRRLAEDLELAEALVVASLRVLDAAGLVELEYDPSPSTGTTLGTISLPTRPDTWRATGWGQQALRLIFPKIEL